MHRRNLKSVSVSCEGPELGGSDTDQSLQFEVLDAIAIDDSV